MTLLDAGKSQAVVRRGEAGAKPEALPPDRTRGWVDRENKN